MGAWLCSLSVWKVPCLPSPSHSRPLPQRLSHVLPPPSGPSAWPGSPCWPTITSCSPTMAAWWGWQLDGRVSRDYSPRSVCVRPQLFPAPSLLQHISKVGVLTQPVFILCLSDGSQTRFLKCFVPQAALICQCVLGRCSFGFPDPVNSMTDEMWDVRFLVWSTPDHRDQIKGLGCKGLPWAAGDSRSGSARGWLPSGCGVSISCTPRLCTCTRLCTLLVLGRFMTSF